MALHQASEPVSLYRQVLAERQRLYDEALVTGSYSPYVYPWDSLPALWLFLALLVLPRLPKRLARILRFPIFATILLQCGWVARSCRSLDFAGGYGIGLSCAWGSIMSFVFLFCKDVSTDYRRLEIRQVETITPTMAYTNGSATTSGKFQNPLTAVKHRNGHGFNGSAAFGANALKPQPTSSVYKLVWQDYPSSSRHAVDWCIDLMTAFRGVNWNFRSPTLPPLKTEAPQDNSSETATATATVTAVPNQTIHRLHLRAVHDFVAFYLLLDLLKTSMMTDPYFLGLTPLSSPSPWPWLSHLNTYLPIATTLVRLLISMSGVIAALTYIFSLSPLFFTLVLPAMTTPFTLTYTPLLEPSMYPSYWSPPLSALLNSSLAGLWGKAWHQLFRHGISSPSTFLISYFQIPPRSKTARAVQLLIAFMLSGAIHASASYTTFSLRPTRPLTGPLAFFVLQALGIILQNWLTHLLYKQYPNVIARISRQVRQAANLLFVLTFLYATGPLLANDFARCGIWLFEPVPVSLLRGLGYGVGGKDEGWWCWSQDGGRWGGLWLGGKGGHWWRTGLAVY